MTNVTLVLLCSLVSVVIGGASGIWVNVKNVSERRAGPSSELHGSAAERTTETLRELKPIVTNLAEPPGAWIRLELSLGLSDAKAATDQRIAEFASDTADFLRSASARQFEGPGGLRRLREDLLERARFRIGKQVDAVLIQTLVVQ